MRRVLIRKAARDLKSGDILHASEGPLTGERIGMLTSDAQTFGGVEDEVMFRLMFDDHEEWSSANRDAVFLVREWAPSQAV